MAKASGATVVLLLVVVPLSMYTCALLAGVQLGRALERRPDGVVSLSFSVRGVRLDFAAKDARKTTTDDPVIGPRVDDRSWPPAIKSGHPYIQQGRRISNHTAHTSPRGVMSVGPWGGSGGQPFHMRGGGGGAPRLQSITVYHGPGAIHSLACDYSLAGDGAGASRRAGPWGRPNSFGSSGLLRATVELSAGEHVVAVEGTTGRFGDVPGEVVTSLMFRTSHGRTYGPYGGGGGGNRPGRGTPFSVPVADGACIAGFWGRSGWLLDALGVYVGPCKYPEYRRTTGYRSQRRQASDESGVALASLSS